MERIRKEEGAMNQFLKYISSVGLVSAVTKTATAPIERIKLIMQTQNILTLNERYKFRSYSSYLTRIPSEQGVQAYWRGNMANVLNIIPQAMAQFLFYDNVQRTFFPQGESVQQGAQYFVNKFLTAVSCGAFSLLFTYPLDTVRVRLSLEMAKTQQHRTYNKVFQSLGEIKSNQGFSQLYRGFLLSNFTNIHYFITLYAFIDVFKNVETQQYLSQDIFNVLHYVGIAQLSSFFSLVAIYPLDTIRRRLQQNGYNRNPVYSGTLDCFQQIKSKEGISSLYRGLGAACTKHILASLLQVTLVNEISKNNLYFY